MRAVASDLQKVDDLVPIGEALAAAIDVLGEASIALLTSLAADPNDALAGATPYQEMFGLTAAGWLMGVSALAAHEALGDDDDAFMRDKIETARFFAGHLLPTVKGLFPTATAGAGDLFAIDADRL